MRRPAETVVHDAIGDPDRILPDAGFNSPNQMQVFAKHGGLLNDALGPKNATVAGPGLAVAGQSGRYRADPPVKRMTHALLAMVIVIVRRRLAGRQNVVEPAGHQEARERSRPGQAVFAFIFVKGGMPEAGRRVPADGLAFVFAFRDVHRPVHEHGEAQSSSRAELQHADARSTPSPRVTSRTPANWVSDPHRSATCRRESVLPNNLTIVAIHRRSLATLQSGLSFHVARQWRKCCWSDRDFAKAARKSTSFFLITPQKNGMKMRKYDFEREAIISHQGRLAGSRLADKRIPPGGGALEFRTSIAPAVARVNIFCRWMTLSVAN